MKKSGRSGTIFAVGVAAILLFSGCSDGAADNQESDTTVATMPPRAVETMEVVEGRLGGQVRISGLVAGTREADVIVETQGRILSVEFDLGQVVNEGDPLVRFDDRTERLAMQQAMEQRNAARLEFDALERQAERGTVSQTALTSARAALRGAEVAYEQALRAYENRTVRAPIGGRVASRSQNVREGNFVTQGTPIGRIVDTTRLRLSGSVGEREVRFLQEGQPALVNVTAWGAERLEATVVAVAAGSDGQTGSFPVAIEWENCCGDVVRSGMSASAVVSTQDTTPGLLVPTAALRRVGDSDFVFVVADGTVQRREVTVRDRFGPQAIVTGVSAGDHVAVTAVSRLRDGDAVLSTRIGTSEDAL